MYVNSAINRKLDKGHIAPIIPYDDLVSYLSPSSGSVEVLIHESLKAEYGFTNRAIQKQVAKSLLKCMELEHFAIGLDHLHLPDHCRDGKRQELLDTFLQTAWSTRLLLALLE